MTITTDYTRTPSMLEEHVAERPGCRVHYWTGGAPGHPVVVLLHGATADHRLFNAQIGAVVGAGYRVVVIDARGHGRSRPVAGRPTIGTYVDDLDAILDAQGIRRATLVGQSFGAYIAQHAIVRDASRFSGLVVVGSTPISFPLSRSDALALRATIALFRIWPWNHLRRLTARSTALTPAAREYMSGCLAGLNKGEFLAIWRAVNTAVSRQGFPRPPEGLPVLWTHGDADRAGTIARDAPRLAAARIPGLCYEVVPDASHNANQDNPEHFNRLLLAFLGAHA